MEQEQLHTQEAQEEEQKDEQAPESSETQTDAALSTKVPKMSNTTALAILVVVVALVAGLEFTGVVDIFSEEPVAAMVNGEKITQGEADARFAAIISSPQAEGIDLNNKEVLSGLRSQILDELINTKLLLQGAAKVGIVADSKVVEDEVQLIITQIGGEEELKSRLIENDLTEAEFKKSIVEQFAIQAYIEANTDVEEVAVTEEEIETFYEQITATSEDVPPLETIHDQIEAQLVSEKQLQIANIFISTLRDAAKINLNP